jgi:hypothetical protein
VLRLSKIIEKTQKIPILSTFLALFFDDFFRLFSLSEIEQQQQIHGFVVVVIVV